MVIWSVPQTIPTTTRTVVTVEDRQRQRQETTRGLKDTKTSVSRDTEDKGNIFNTSTGVSRHLIQYFNYIVVVSIIGAGNQSTRWNAPTLRKSLVFFISFSCIEYTSLWNRIDKISFDRHWLRFYATTIDSRPRKSFLYWDDVVNWEEIPK